MRDLLRLVLVAVMSFAVVGIAMLYSRGGDLGTSVRSFGSGAAAFASTVSESVGLSEPAPATPTAAAETETPQSPVHTLVLPRPNAAQWAGLAGFPDQAEVIFPLPRGQSFLSGALNLSFDTQLAEHGDGLLTLSVNGTPRGQVVLDSGRAQHQIRIALTPADLAGERIVLHMAGRGNTNSGQICPTDAANSGSAVTLSADSGLELQSDRPLADAVQALVIAPQPLVLSPGISSGDMALTIWANQMFNRSGIAARIGTAGNGETPVTISQNAVLAAGVASGNSLAGKSAVDQVIAAMGATVTQPVGWPVNVADLGAETIVKSFRGSRRWTIPFNAVDLPGGGLPEQFRLRLKTTPLADNNDWVVRISLNGNLIDTRRLAGATDTIAFDVPLPAERMLPANALVVELVDTTPNEGICTRGPDAQAQLQPESALLDLGGADAGWAKLVSDLASAADVGLEADPGLSAAQAARGGELLSMVLPRKAAVRFDGMGAVKLSMVSRQGLAQYLTGQAADASIKALLPGATGNAAPLLVDVPSAELGTALERLGPDDVVILISGL